VLIAVSKRNHLLATSMLAGWAAAALAAAPVQAQTAAPTPQAAQVPGQTQNQDVPAGVQTPADAREAVDQENESGRQSVQQVDSAPDDGEAEVEQVIVTGSRISRPQYEGVIPGAQVDAAEIENRAFVNVLDILNDVPLVGNGTALTTNGGQTSSLGVGFVDLLDLGTQRTLTLVNGRRFVSGNAATLFVAGNATGSQVDVNNIPVSLIERVDVLTVGGAAAYGSDAIAGVVNYVLRDDYEGLEGSVLTGVTDRGDAGSQSLRALAGRNFLDDRVNVAVSYEYNHLDSLTADAREFRIDNPSSVSNFANGGVRNPAFDPAQLVSGSNRAFLLSSSDFQPGSVFLPEASTIQVQPGGAIFNVLGSGTLPPVNQIGPSARTFFSGVTQLVGGVPTTCNPFSASGNPICTFAPSSVTDAQAAQVFASFGVTPPADATAAQRRVLAANILQANRPTPREYFGANPGTNLNAFLGTFIAALPDVPNTDPATRAFLPRVAVPIRFNDQGAVETYTVATLDPSTPGTVGTAPGGQGHRGPQFTTLRVEQDRHIGNLFGKVDLTENIEFFTENLFAEVTSVAPRNAASTNTVSTSTVENLALVMNVNNPFLDDGDRAALAAAGITGNFVLSRTNQDIFGDNPNRSEIRTTRSSNGLRGDFNALGRSFDWETSLTWGRVEQEVRSQTVRDLEYALAIDAATDPSGNIVCRAQLNPSAFLGRTPGGIVSNVITVPGPDGVPTQQTFIPTVTQDLIDTCQPLDPFGFNQMSEAAKAYVRGRQIYSNTSEQLFGQAFISGSLFELPAGPLGFSVAGEFRQDELEFSTNELNRLGRGRSAPSAQTQGETTALEAGVEFLIPVFGGDFSFPFLRNLDISPAVRFSKQEGEAPTYRGLGGQLLERRAEGDWERIESLAFTYKPIEDLTFRGNTTKSIRQPSATELFLGVQPSFTTVTDPCSNQNIGSGARPDVRRANCVAAVIAQGLRDNEAEAEAFLNTFVASTASRQGTFSGRTDLRPERGESWTVGMVVQPRFLPGFQASVDYIDLEVQDQIQTLSLTLAAQLCFDSPTFPDNEPQVGVNTCTTFNRNAAFQVETFARFFINLASTRLKAYNISADYRFDVGERLGRLLGREGQDLGDVRLRLRAFHLEDFLTSATGAEADAQQSAGSAGDARPEWETQLTGSYSRGPFDLSYTVNRTGALRTFSSGRPATIENFSILEFPAVSIHSATVGYEFQDRYRVQFTADNITDVVTYGDEGFLAGNAISGYPDTLGRRYTLSLRAAF